MKALQYLLILALIKYCFTDIDTTICETTFEELLKQKCKAIDSSCTYDSDEHKCIETRDCSYGNGKTTTFCEGIHPANFHTEKCILDGTTCKSKRKQCSDYGAHSITGDTCSELEAPTNDQRCILTNSLSSPCKAHYKLCAKIETNANNECNDNIPEDPLYKCLWDDTKNECKTSKRYCDDNDLYYTDSETCPTIPVAETDPDHNKKKCIYTGTTCQSEYEKCEERTVSSGSDCENHMPLNADKDNYDYTKKCTEDTSSSSTKCKAVTRKCKEFNLDQVSIPIPNDLLSEELCNQLEVSEDYKRCAYRENECYEEYKTCEDYTSNKVETDRNSCESIVLTDKTKKCVYIKEKDQCETRTIYSNCKDYPGNDKKICESIKLPSNNRSYCILDKDKECIEKSLNCSEAYNEDDCINIAIASENNKRCAYDTNNLKCYEEYIRCEDYIGTSSIECKNIKLYNGKNCIYESVTGINGNVYGCRSNYKSCKNAATKEECKLIAITGVSDPERKVCDYFGSPNECQENYKYCSDYRGGDPTICSYIKPYDESGNEVDIRYKCEYEPNVGCQRVPVECEDAGDNAILCETFSQYIKDKDKKYCLFYGSTCTTQFQKCEDYEYSYRVTSCSGNIIKGNIRNVCHLDSGKCVTKNDCSLFIYPTSYTLLDPPLSKYYKDLCQSINPNCTFETSGKCIYKENSCGGTIFYTDDENNKQICENIQVDEPYKKCVLKEDKSGCEKVYRELNYSTTYNSYTNNSGDSNQQNSSDFIFKRINLVILIISLLI